MKKFLVVLLALAMVFAIATTAMAADTQIQDYNDTTTSTQYASDIYRLTALGVLCGDNGWGGAYRPTSHLTRAEFAKIAVYMYGKQDYVDYYKAQKSAFSDVPEGHWAEGYINLCNEFGLMVGVGGGKFAPNADVTKQEVATVCLRAVGYTDAGLPGDWPQDFIAKSTKVHTWFEDEYKDELSLYQYVEKIDGTAATRAEMAAIANYCLDLYRVEYVGSSKTIVYGIGGYVDNDGFAYKTADTNEPYGAYATLLWDAFNAYVVPTWQFQYWDAGERNQNRFVEASGWGYEDFKEGELLFKGAAVYDYDDNYTPLKTDSTIEETNESKGQGPVSNENGMVLPVATDYYIFDQYLDGELWQLGARYAFLTVQKNGSKDEALFAEMLSDVNYYEEEHETGIKKNHGYPVDYVKVDNADVFSGTEWKDDTDYAFYDYDWFKHAQFAIVKEVNKNEIILDNALPGTEFKDPGWFCIEDGCKKHSQKYVILKDGALQDPTCLKVDDVVYAAGKLAVTNKGKDPVYLFIAYTPEAGTLDKLASPGNPTAEYSLTISGDAYQYCYNKPAHQYSKGGYAADAPYANMTFNDMMGYVKEDCLFTIGYGKLYVATLIFDAAYSNDQYGVLTDFATAFDYLPAGGAVTATGVTFFGADEATNSYDFDEEQYLGNIYQDQTIFRNLLGGLANYSLDEDGNVIVDSIGDKLGDDVGYIIPFRAMTPSGQTVTFNDDGRTADYGKADSISGYWNGGFKSFQYMQITHDTVIFEVSGGWDFDDYGNLVYDYDSVKLGNPDDYIGKTVTAQQMAIFAWDDRDITVLYVRNVHFNGDIVKGVITGVEYDGDNYLITFEDGTVLIGPESQASIFANLADGERYYGVYKVQDGEVSNVVLSGYAWPEVPAGNLYVLFAEDGYMMDPGTVSAVLTRYNDDADGAAGFFDYIDDVTDLADGCEYVDLTGDGDFGRDSFESTGSHSGDGDYVYYLVFDNATHKIYQIFRFADDTPFNGTITRK